MDRWPCGTVQPLVTLLPLLTQSLDCRAAELGHSAIGIVFEDFLTFLDASAGQIHLMWRLLQQFPWCVPTCVARTHLGRLEVLALTCRRIWAESFMQNIEKEGRQVQCHIAEIPQALCGGTVFPIR